MRPHGTLSVPNLIKCTHLWMSMSKPHTVRHLILRCVASDSSCQPDADYSQHSSSSTENIFDELPALSAPLKSDLCDELDRYLSTDPEHVTDALSWWYEKRSVYPRLHHMALDYLTIPGEFSFVHIHCSLIIIPISYVC